MDCLICKESNGKLYHLRDSELHSLCKAIHSLSDTFIEELKKHKEGRICQNCVMLLGKMGSIVELIESLFGNLRNLEGILSQLFIHSCESDVEVQSGQHEMRRKIWAEILNVPESKSEDEVHPSSPIQPDGAPILEAIKSVEESKDIDIEMPSLEQEDPIEIEPIEVEVETSVDLTKSISSNADEDLQSEETVLVEPTVEKAAEIEPEVQKDLNCNEVIEPMDKIETNEVSPANSSNPTKMSKRQITMSFIKAGGGITCKICDKRYKDKKALKIHTALHTRPKFRCPECPREFTSEERLKNHFLLTHSTNQREKPFKCDLCTKSFLGDSSLKRHMAKFHVPLTFEDEVQETSDIECPIVTIDE